MKAFLWGKSKKNVNKQMWTMWISQKSNRDFVQSYQLTIKIDFMVTGNVNFL